MDELFTKYESELVGLKSLSREYAQRYPKVAARLQLGGDTCDDPHVERLLQGVALLSARIGKRLDDSYPQFTEALLGLLFPHFLRPFPSCAIARVIAQPGPACAMPRGTRLDSAPQDGVACTFTTAYDVTPCPFALAGAGFSTPIRAPVATRLDPGVASVLTLRFTASLPAPDHGGRMRLYVDADASLCAALRDALFIHARGAYLQLDDGAPWLRLPDMPVMPVGFADDEALIPFDARSHQAYRILQEYFAFPEKFNFFDIDIKALLARLPPACPAFSLHITLDDIPAGGDKARMLANLSAQHLLQGCTPVVNLFAQPGVPITHDRHAADYTLLAHGKAPHAYEVYSVERVRMVRTQGEDANATEFRPFYSLHHAHEPGHAGRYWLMRHDEELALCSPGHEKSIALVDADGDPFEIERDVLSIELRCTNRDLPCALRIGAPEGDLFMTGAAVHLLRRPTRPARADYGPGMHWRLISHLALNHHSLTQADAAGLREMLTLYDLAPSPVSRRQIAGVVALDESDTTAWIRHRRGSSLAHGSEIRLTLDEQAWAGAGMHLFVQVLDHFFGLYVHVNSFVELVILSQQSGKELFRCRPRKGSMRLV